MSNDGSPPMRIWPWKRISAILIICLVVVICLFVATALWPVPVRTVQQTGIEWHTLNDAAQFYEFDSGDLTPPPSQCVGTSTFLCSDLWVAFNWSTHDGQPLTFGFESDQGYPQPVVLYTSSNLSFGGYSFYCGARAPCGDPFLITTNDTSGQAWNFDWEEIYNYTATESNAPLL